MIERLHMSEHICHHLAQASYAPPRIHVCEDCVKTGGRWVHLRTCLTCGHVGCCDSSPNRHATKHFHTSLHPVIASAEPGEHWLWCYLDEQMVE